MSGFVLQAQGVCKYFGREIALENLSLQLDVGDCALLLGPNGSGKSTFLALASGLLSPSKGKLDVFGLHPRKVLTKVGYANQKPYLYQEMSLREALLELGRPLLAQRARARVESVLDELGLSAFSHKTVRSCSLGVAKRLSIARALLSEPRLLLLDEPLASLDLKATELVVACLGRLKAKGVSMLIATHELRALSAITNKQFELSAGRLIVERPSL